MSQDLEKFGMPEEELFAPVDHSDLESEKITAPRYSYWHSVFRVFFKKKINIIIGDSGCVDRIHLPLPIICGI